MGLCRKALEPQREGTPRRGRDASGRRVRASLGAGCVASLHSSHCHARCLYRRGPAFQSLLASHVAVDNVSHSLSFTLLHGAGAAPSNGGARGPDSMPPPQARAQQVLTEPLTPKFYDSSRKLNPIGLSICHLSFSCIWYKFRKREIKKGKHDYQNYQDSGHLGV